jgi:hypothetical protein
MDQESRPPWNDPRAPKPLWRDAGWWFAVAAIASKIFGGAVFF